MARTPNYKFDLVPFDTRPWHEREHDNWRQLDAILATLTTIVNIVGVWSNSTAYTAGERLVDGDTGSIWTCAVDHVSASTGTFAADRAANPTYWLTFTVDQRFRGTWVSGEDYLVNDFVVADNIYAVATAAHTAGATFAGDSANWAYLVDLTSDLASIAVSVSDAASSAADAAASAATVNLPSMVGESLNMLRANLGATGYEFRTPAEVLSDIAAQASSARLTDIAALATTDGNFIVGNGATWVAESGVTVRASLGLAIGTDVQAYDADTVKAPSNSLPVLDGSKLTGIAFLAHKNGVQQQIAHSTATKVTYPTEAFDVGGGYDAANSKFQPTVAGYYRLTHVLRWATGVAGKYGSASIRKNGNDIAIDAPVFHDTLGISSTTTTIAYANGTTDYFEAYAFQDTGGPINTTGLATDSYFCGNKVS